MMICVVIFAFKIIVKFYLPNQMFILNDTGKACANENSEKVVSFNYISNYS